MSDSYQLEIPSDPKEIMSVERFLEEINGRLHLDEMKFNKLLVATTEAVNNGIIHGNKRDYTKKVLLRVEVNSTTMTVKVLAEENLLRENGRGVFLIRSLMSSVGFEKFPDGWEVTMRMDLD
jgi:serine/threonine-protein kinase RsbW